MQHLFFWGGCAKSPSYERRHSLMYAFFVHYARGVTHSMAIYPTRGNAIAFGFKLGDVINCGHMSVGTRSRTHLYAPLYGRTSEAINAKFFAIKYVTGVFSYKNSRTICVHRSRKLTSSTFYVE